MKISELTPVPDSQTEAATATINLTPARLVRSQWKYLDECAVDWLHVGLGSWGGRAPRKNGK